MIVFTLCFFKTRVFESFCMQVVQFHTADSLENNPITNWMEAMFHPTLTKLISRINDCPDIGVRIQKGQGQTTHAQGN